MFNSKKTKIKVDEIDTVIGPGSSFKGDIEATGMVRVDGNFAGSITTKGDVFIGEDGFVEGKISSRNVMIAGKVVANINCEQKLEIKPTGKLLGDCHVNSIEIAEGAILKGQCQMRNEEDSKSGKDKERLNEGTNI